MVIAPIWSENGYRLPIFGLESGAVFVGTTEVFERICRFNSRWKRKKDSNLSNDDLISAYVGLKTGVGFRGQVWQRVWIMAFFGLK